MSSWIEGLARAGYASKGMVYAIMGFIALRGAAADHRSAFNWILEKPFGRTMLAAMAVGLLGYAFWRAGSAVADWERRGNDAKGYAIRIGSLFRGMLYAGFALEVIRLALHKGSGGKGSDASAQHWTARAMDAPFGRWLVAGAGLALIGYGIYQLINAWKAKLSNQLRLGEMKAATRRRVVIASRFGIAARGVVFGIIGISVLMAGLHHNSGEARGTSGALRQLSSQPFGSALLAIIGLGLIAYGVYAFVNARYRVIRAD
ncbi:MAG TPA: DUF1206 domain-containing protein [Thermoanaerobaculia bacterium]